MTTKEDIQKLQTNLVTKENEILKSIIKSILSDIFEQMPSLSFLNRTGSEDAAGNVTYYKDSISNKTLLNLDSKLESPIYYYSTDLAISAEEVYNRIKQEMKGKIVKVREASILEAEHDAAVANSHVTELDIKNCTDTDLKKTINKMISNIREIKSVDIGKLGIDQIYLKVTPYLYQRLFNIKLIIPETSSNNKRDFTNNSFNFGKYRGITLIEDIYLNDVNPDLQLVLSMIGAIASPWRQEGVANGLCTGESTIFFLNPQVRYKTQAIYPEHIFVLKSPSIDNK